VIPASFDYVRPSSIAEAVQAVGSGGEDAKVLAGGQSLLPVLRLRMSYPDTLIDLGGIAELRGVREDGQAIVIGSMTTHDEVTRNPLVKQYAPLLAQATATVGDRQVRHLGTFGGSLSHADPAGDLPTVALTLDAQLHVEGPNGSRVIAAKDFFLDYLTTALEPGEVLTAIRVPKLGDGWSSHYEKFSRVAQAWSIVSVAAVVRRDNGAIAESKIGLTNMGSTPLRATAVETALIGAEVSPEAIGEASNHAAEGTNAPSDLSGRADYRNHLAKVLTKRAVLAAAHR
jgi:carbon-monoxide dehydrogenase medium subunit